MILKLTDALPARRRTIRLRYAAVAATTTTTNTTSPKSVRHHCGARQPKSCQLSALPATRTSPGVQELTEPPTSLCTLRSKQCRLHPKKLLQRGPHLYFRKLAATSSTSKHRTGKAVLVLIHKPQGIITPKCYSFA
ncbi:uncharacterized protein PV06_08319 [Exophiala oligosperma]|uniref:Uncharacterized protein n=1 Tax=Exophiala oligosperma TaxID=215243 RepID=A0A0D2DB70_9EURO|nr:uncharacterized protein PV06_08319 [Exophiala oligosperma]KIW39730.1 hypothetical protein PV06_08319 [Exophiala oligosperma]